MSSFVDSSTGVPGSVQLSREACRRRRMPDRWSLRQMEGRMASRIVVLLATAALAACVSAPKYQPPTVVVAPEFRAVADSGSHHDVGSSVSDSTAVSAAGS